MSFNYSNSRRQQQGVYSPTSISQYSDYSQNYSPTYSSGNSNNYSPVQKYSPTYSQQQQYYNQQQMLYQKKQQRMNQGGPMQIVSQMGTYSINPEAAFAYRQRKMQQAAERKYQKLCRLTNRLRDQLRLQTVPVSKAAYSLVSYTISVKDPLLPSVWGPIEKRDNPYAVTNNTCACVIM